MKESGSSTIALDLHGIKNNSHGFYNYVYILHTYLSISKVLIPETAIELVTIIDALVALLGAYLVGYTAYTARKRMDDTLLRARAFLSESFLRDNGVLLFLMCLFFLIHTATELNRIFGLFVEESVVEFVKEFTELGIAVCIVISAYKWFKLVNPVEHLNKPQGENIILQRREPGKSLRRR